MLNENKTTRRKFMTLRKIKHITALGTIILSLTEMAWASGGRDRYNLTSNALGGLVGLANLEFSYKFTDHLTVGVTGYSGRAKLQFIGIL